MILPANGLTSFSEIVNKYYYVKIIPFKEGMVKIELLTNLENEYEMHIGENIEFNLELNKKFEKT